MPSRRMDYGNGNVIDIRFENEKDFENEHKRLNERFDTNVRSPNYRKPRSKSKRKDKGK